MRRNMEIHAENREDRCLREAEAVFRVEDFGVSFSQYENGISRRDLQVITNLDIELYEGKILAVVGSSGSGKSLLAHAIMGILPENAAIYGRLYYRGRQLTQEKIRDIRGKKICLIPQSVNYLDPLEKIGSQIKRAIPGKRSAGKKEIVLETLRRYGLEPSVYDAYPHQLSGGMARKVLLAIALLSDCDILIADEPTPGLDEPSLMEALEDFRMTAREGKAILMITHDIQAATQVADRIAVFYAGSTLEVADAEEFKGDGKTLRHPYSRALLSAMPQKDFRPIPGVQPMPGALPDGCLFYDRCDMRTRECHMRRPPLRQLRGGKVRCFHAT